MRRLLVYGILLLQLFVSSVSAESHSNSQNNDPGGYSGGGWNPMNWYRWVYTGDANAPDYVYEAALNASGESVQQNVEPVHTALDVVGVADPTGAADGINAGLYAGMGDTQNASISAVGIIPFVGDAAKTGRFAGKVAKYGDEAVEVAEAAITGAGRYTGIVDRTIDAVKSVSLKGLGEGITDGAIAVKAKDWKKIDQAIRKKFEKALEKGMASSATGETGIKVLKNRGGGTGFTHELKIAGTGARLLGSVEDGVLVFNRYVADGLH